jgi:SAM-dependent methyltransferase
MTYLGEMAASGYNASAIGSFHQTMIPYLMSLAGLGRDACVVDIGAGQGHGLIPLWHTGYRNLVAVDKEQLNFTLFIERYGFRCVQCDVERAPIPLPDHSADVVFCLHVIEHLEFPGFLLDETFRILRSRGHLFVVTPDWRKQIKTFWRDPTHRHPYDRESLGRLLRMFGFQRIRIHAWGSRFGLGRLRAYIRFPRLGMIGIDLLGHARRV